MPGLAGILFFYLGQLMSWCTCDYCQILKHIDILVSYNQGQRVAENGKMSVAWQILTIQGDIQADMLGLA